jgi:hypothetical protein
MRRLDQAAVSVERKQQIDADLAGDWEGAHKLLNFHKNHHQAR